MMSKNSLKSIKKCKLYVVLAAMIKEIFNFIANNKWYFLLVAILLGVYFFQFHGGLSSNSEKWDHFGSYIGGIFSAITLLSVLHGMQLERKRFEEQKIEFEKERQEQKVEFEKERTEQEERKRKEDFERTFFMMLEQHNINLRELENKLYSDKRLVNEIYKIIVSKRTFSEIRNHFKEKDYFYSDLDVYFLNLYRVLKFLHKNKVYNIDNEYSSLLRSFISRKMLVILAYHLCNIEEQYREYINYINEFCFLEHLDLTDLEFRFISILTGREKEELKYNFLSYSDYENESYDGDEYYPFYYNTKNGEELDELVILPFIESIFSRKHFKNEIECKVFIVDDWIKEKMGVRSDYDDEEQKTYYQDAFPFEDKHYWDNIFFHILNTFSENAFRKEQNDKYRDFKTIYKIFLNDSRNK